MCGPIELDTSVEWDDFLEPLAGELDVRTDQLITQSFKWQRPPTYTKSGQERKPPPGKPLTNAAGLAILNADVLRLANQPDGPGVIVMTVSMAWPRRPSSAEDVSITLVFLHIDLHTFPRYISNSSNSMTLPLQMPLGLTSIPVSLPLPHPILCSARSWPNR